MKLAQIRLKGKWRKWGFFALIAELWKAGYGILWMFTVYTCVKSHRTISGKSNIFLYSTKYTKIHSLGSVCVRFRTVFWGSFPQFLYLFQKHSIITTAVLHWTTLWTLLWLCNMYNFLITSSFHLFLKFWGCHALYFYLAQHSSSSGLQKCYKMPKGCCWAQMEKKENQCQCEVQASAWTGTGQQCEFTPEFTPASANQ